MASYGTIYGAQAFAQHITLDATNNPSTVQAQAWLDQQSAKLTGWLKQAGYTVPVVQTEAKAILDYYANIGTAGLMELAQRTGGYGQADEEDRRENRFLAEFARAEAYINSGALLALGVPQTSASATGNAPAVGHLTAGTGHEVPLPIGRPWEFDRWSR